VALACQDGEALFLVGTECSVITPPVNYLDRSFQKNIASFELQT
jgi:hypothetical protein